MATEEPSFHVVARLGEAEIRAYAPVILAETVVDGSFDSAGNAAFRRLAGYIFGGNRPRSGSAATKIAMTAPVGMRPAEKGSKIAMTAPVGMKPAAEGSPQGSWIVSFTMPGTWTMATLPEPTDPRVTLREVPGRSVAALRFSGFWSADRFAARERALRSALAGSGWHAVAAAESARYDPPWTPWFMRRNEVLIEVARDDG